MGQACSTDDDKPFVPKPPSPLRAVVAGAKHRARAHREGVGAVGGPSKKQHQRSAVRSSGKSPYEYSRCGTVQYYLR